jgi:hypothetical protein
MALTYEDVGTRFFGDREFSTSEFARRISTPRAAKALAEMKKRGVVARTARGRYRFLGPSERPDLRAVEWARVREIILSAPFAKAWTGPTAVEAWTGDRYAVAASPYLREFNVAILPADLIAWGRYLRKAGIATTARKRVGALVRLWPTDEFEFEIVRGEPVIPRAKTKDLIRAESSIYAGAEGLIRD